MSSQIKFVRTNKKPKEKHYTFSSFGFSTILLIFVSLCILTFGVLAIVTANADLKLSKKVAEKSKGYHQAEETSYEYLTQVEEILHQAYDTKTGADYDREVSEALGQLEFGFLAESDESSGTIIYGWEVSITDNQLLSVSLEILPYEQLDGEQLYTLLSWCDVHHEEEGIIYDDTLNVLGKE